MLRVMTKKDGKGDGLQVAEQLSELSGRFKRWRARHGGPGRRIPRELWEAAAATAVTAGIRETAVALRLSGSRLEWFVEAIRRDGLGELEEPGLAVAKDPGFVELSGAGLCLGSSILDIERRDGDRFCVQTIPGAMDLPVLVRMFLETER